MRFKLLVFDWDGTLSDSIGVIVQALKVSIKDAGLQQRSLDELQSIIGLGLNEAIFKLYPDIPIKHRNELVELYRVNYRSMSKQHPNLFPHAEDTIRQLHSEGYYLAVATGKSRLGLDRSLAESGLGDYFHASCCPDEAFSKPHPQMLEMLMTDLDSEPAKTLMIGDTEHDMQMAKNAGVSAAAVKYGAQNVDLLLVFEPET